MVLSRERRRGGFVLLVSLLAFLVFHNEDASVPPVTPSSPKSKGTGRRWLLNSVGATMGSTSGMQVQPAQAGLFDVFDVPAPPDVAKPPADAQVLPSGLVTKMLLRPSCALSVSQKLDSPDCIRPLSYDKVTIDYTGWTSAGKMFDTSRLERKSVRVNSVMKGWEEGLQLMSPGEKRRFWIPANLAFTNSSDTAKPAGDLVFDIDLYSIARQPKPPADLVAIPADATRSESGLAFQVVKPGTGSRKPLATSNVTVLYNTWTSNGDLILSTSFGAPENFVVQDFALKGFSEALQLMVEGETRRLWIPPTLAFGDRSGRTDLPQGNLVSDVRLLNIND
eukprot:TRINITY_DN78736_c0_g1_i1.p1 TRINITY_DN78736_c0_g1~~TRINITY_DN78736_c0_g1_i1.p1  ORF type:complete len:361 (-),score=48.43 TRINITY_DN78736_c0_g1_i1:90-1097(-)